MDHGNRVERHPGPGKFQHDASAGAIAKGGEPVGVRTGHREEHVQRRAADRPHPIGVGNQRHDPGQHRVRLAGEQPAAVVVHRQSHVAPLCQVVGAIALILMQARNSFGERLASGNDDFADVLGAVRGSGGRTRQTGEAFTKVVAGPHPNS